MIKIYRSPVRPWWPIALSSWLGTVSLSLWIDRGDRLSNFAQLATSASLMLFSIFSIFSVVTTRPKRSMGSKLWQLWQKPPAIGRDELLEAIRQEVTARSQQSLHYAVLNTLMFEKHPGEKIPRLWDVDLKIGQQPSRPLNPTETILDNFPDASNLGRVLMLGMQGAGKTSTLLEMAAELCLRARNNPQSPIPILLDLPNWHPKQPFPNWILSEIEAKYGVSIEDSQQWLEAGQLLLLLDGLDELNPSEQQACVAALNELKLSDGRSQPLVVCTRMNCYKQVGKQLKFSAAIGLKSLTIQQIQDYLTGARSRELWENIKEDNQLLSLAKNPWLLNLMTLAHEEILIHAWKRIPNKKDRVEYLLNAYLRSQLGRSMTSQWYPSGKEPSPEQSKHWLKWLATTMTEKHYTEFSLDNLPYPPLDYAGHFIALGIVWILVIMYTGLFINFYTLKIGLTYAVFFMASAWGCVILLAWNTRQFKLKTYSPKILVISGVNSMILFGLGLLSFQLNSLMITQADGQTGVLLYGLSLLIFIIAIAPVLGLMASIYAALPWMKHLSLRLTLWRHGDIPWNYGKFLQFLTERLLMQNVRGRYRFIHPLLGQHCLTLDR